MNIDLQLSELRRALDVATTKIDGQLAVLLQKSDYAEQRAKESAEHVNNELAIRDKVLEGLTNKINVIQTRLFFLSGFAAAIGTAAGIITALVTKGG